ncbi:uncharacterized protein FYW61_005404 [Anableps anableps]
MDVVWVVSLILGLVSTRLSLIEATGERSIICSSVAVKKGCTTTSDVVCECPDGHYSNHGECYECSSPLGDENEDYRNMCLSCQSTWCMANPECKKKCPINPDSFIITPDTTPMALSVATKTVTTVSTASPTVQSRRPTLFTTLKTSSHTTEKSPKHSDNLFTWFSFVGAVVTSLVVFWFLLLFCKSLLRKEDVLPCWNTKKMLGRLPQEPKFDEQRSHHCSSPTTLTFTNSEETPMMSLCQEPSAHISGHMQQGVHTDGRRYEHSDRWPAIVLYAIIKEVPLRRWKEFLRLLSVPDQQMERVELDTGLGSLEKQYQMLKLWSQRSSASMNDVYSSLHQMDLSGCAQQLQENLKSLQWSCKARQGLTV